MCLADVARVVAVDEASVSASVDAGDGRRATVSLLVLAHDGPLPRPGDWIVAQTGLGVRRLDDDEAASILAARAGLDHPTPGPGGP
jgi:hydrogenase maturation factor